MTSRNPKTLAEARALREVSMSDLMFERIEREVDGLTVVSHKARKLVAGPPLQGDDILWFTDADGREMRVACDESGPVKCAIF